MKDKSVKGVLWLFISKFFPPIINFGVFTYSARILMPEDFGLVAFALSIIFICNSFMPIGWRESIIKYQINDVNTISTVFWLNLFVSLLLSGLLVIFCLLSLFEFQTAIFNSALMIFTIKLVFDGLGATSNIILLKNQEYSLLAVRTVFSSIVSAMIILSLLELDFGVWALIWAQVILSIANFIVVYIPTRHFVSLHFSLADISKFKEFALYTTCSNGLTAALNNYESVVIGSILGKRDLGFYSVAKRLATVINDICVGTLSEISFPILAQQQAELKKFQKAFLSSVYFSVLLLFPIFSFGLVAGKEIFLFLFTAKWSQSVIVFQAFCIMFMIVTLGIPQKNIILLTNNAKWWFKLQVKLSFILVPITTMSAYGGIHTLLIALILSRTTYCSLSMWRSCNLLQISLKEYILNFLMPFTCCLFAALSTFFLRPYLDISEHPLVNILILALFFTFLYAFSMLLFDRNKLFQSCLVLFPDNRYFNKWCHTTT